VGRAIPQPLGDARWWWHFADIRTPDTFAQAGFFVSDGKTIGYVHELSKKRHVRND